MRRKKVCYFGLMNLPGMNKLGELHLAVLISTAVVAILYLYRNIQEIGTKKYIPLFVERVVITVCVCCLQFIDNITIL